MQQIYLLLCVVMSIACSSSLFAQNCPSFIQDAHQLAQTQLIRTKVQPLVMRGVESYSAQLICDQSGLTLKMLAEGSRPFRTGDELIFGAKGAFLNLAFTHEGERAMVGDAPVSTNLLSLDVDDIDWFNAHPVTTIFIRTPDREGVRKITLPEERRSQFNELMGCFSTTINRELIADRKSNALEVKYPGEPRPFGSYEATPVADVAANPVPGEAEARDDAAIAGLRADLSALRQEVQAQIEAERRKVTTEKKRLAEELAAAREATIAAIDAQGEAVVKARERGRLAVEAADQASADRIAEHQEKATQLLAEREDALANRLTAISEAENEIQEEALAKITAREEALRKKLWEIEAGEAKLTEELKERHSKEREQLIAEFEAERERILLAREKLQADFTAAKTAQAEALDKVRAEGEAALQLLRDKYAAEKKRIQEATASLEGKG